MDWLRKYWIKALLLTASSFLAAIVFWTSVLAGEDDYKDKGTMLQLGTIAAFTVILVTAADTALNEREKEQARQEVARAARTLGTTYNATLVPISDALGKLAQEYAAVFASAGVAVPPSLSSTQAAQSTVICRTVLIGASILTADPLPGGGLPRARCAFYRLKDRATHTFEREDWAGAPPAPRLTLDNAKGAHLLHDIIDSDAAYHVSKATGYTSVVDPMSLKYKSVIAVPVIAGTTAFGVLAVDAPGDMDLTGEHVFLMKSLAGLLAATLALS
ncbi:hypothetical protein OHU07_21740 [Streptomyces phaeochromogenes]